MQQHVPPFIPPQFSGPGMPPFGMPPPNWNAPWQNSHPTPPWQSHPPAEHGKIDPQIIAKAAEWSEHRAPDGRPYYFHAGRGESVWERPQALKDLDEAKMNPGPAGFMPHHQMMGQMVPPNAINVAPPHHSQVQVQGNIMFDPMGAIIKPDAQKDLAEMEREKKRREMEEKKKKEEAEKAAAEKSKQLKPQDKSKPISSTPISGTPW